MSRSSPPPFVTVAKTGEIASGGRKIVEVRGHEIAILNVNGAFCAVGNTCPHEGGPVGEGEIAGGEITCPWHAWSFNLTTGACVTTEDEAIPIYPVKVEGDEIKVAV